MCVMEGLERRGVGLGSRFAFESLIHKLFRVSNISKATSLLLNGDSLWEHNMILKFIFSNVSQQDNT